MKLVRYGQPGKEKPGIIDDDGRVRDLSGIVSDIDGETLAPKMLAKIKKAKLASLPLVRGTPRLGACVGTVPTYYAIGLNYADHAAESNS
ncbi:MAG: ureidoglycolate lyase, partial [Rhizobiales bacterium]|nr:ureidoglycolate lyase [Hyphomicrobiales bacterium]